MKDSAHDIVVMTDDGAGTYEVRTVVFCGDCMMSLMERPASDGAIPLAEVIAVAGAHEREVSDG